MALSVPVNGLKESDKEPVIELFVKVRPRGGRGGERWGGGASSRLGAESARAPRPLGAPPPPRLLPPSAFPPGGLRVPSRLPRAAPCGPRGPRSRYGPGSPSEHPPNHGPGSRTEHGRRGLRSGRLPARCGHKSGAEGVCPAPGGSAGAAVSQSAQMERAIAPADRKQSHFFLRGEK